MQRDEITSIRQYAIRERVAPGEPLQRVEVIEHARGTEWKVRFLDEPHPGLVDYVTSKQSVCAWADGRCKYLRDEERLTVLDALDSDIWDGHPRSEGTDRRTFRRGTASGGARLGRRTPNLT